MCFFRKRFIFYLPQLDKYIEIKAKDESYAVSELFRRYRLKINLVQDYKLVKQALSLEEGHWTLTPVGVVRFHQGLFIKEQEKKGKHMHKKSGWKVIADNGVVPMTDEEYQKYRKKMFKWGLWVKKMKTEKPKFNKAKKDAATAD